MGYTTTLNGQERTVTGIAFLPGTMGSMVITFDGGERVSTNIAELTGQYGYYPESAYVARDLLYNIRSLVAAPVKTEEEGGGSGREGIIKKLDLNEQDFEAYLAIESRIKESNKLHDRLNRHESWHPSEPSSFWQRR